MLIEIPRAPHTFKERVKASLRDFPFFYKIVETLSVNALYVSHIARHGLVPAILGRHDAKGPLHDSACPTWSVDLPPWSHAADLIASLRACGVAVREGGHTFYVPPQESLRRLMPAVVNFYPPDCGFKILRDCRHPARARYLFKHRFQLPVLGRLVGSPLDRVAPANYMHTLGIGPRVWALSRWVSGPRECSVFAVEHVEGRVPTRSEYDGFIRRLDELFRRTRLRPLIPLWREDPDFAPTDCNGNLIYSPALGELQYVDFQNFGLAARDD